MLRPGARLEIRRQCSADTQTGFFGEDAGEKIHERLDLRWDDSAARMDRVNRIGVRRVLFQQGANGTGSDVTCEQPARVVRDPEPGAHGSADMLRVVCADEPFWLDHDLALRRTRPFLLSAVQTIRAIDSSTSIRRD